MNNDSRMLLYLSIMALILSCVVLGYGLVFFGWGPQASLNGISMSPGAIIVAGLVLATINGIASNILANQLGKSMETLPPALRVGIPLAVFFITFVFSILIALMST